MAVPLEFYTAEDLGNTLKQTGISLREISKAVFPANRKDYLSHKIREGNFNLIDLIRIKEYIDYRCGEGIFDLCHKRYLGQKHKVNSYIKGGESNKQE